MAGKMELAIEKRRELIYTVLSIIFITEQEIMYRNEYPRPHFVREDWLCLNGQWEFEIEKKSGGDYLSKEQYSDTINVPFCPESKLSGIEHRGFIRSVWYRRSFSVTKKQLQGRVILHFGAVDYQAAVYVNGEIAGEHKGGYVSFSFDITDKLKEGENVLVLNAKDNTRSRAIPSGKQSTHKDSIFCVYTRTTGIWQSVWLEYVNRSYISSCKIDADCDTSLASVSFKTVGCAGKKAVINISYNGKNCGAAQCDIEKDNFTLKAKVEGELQLWQPLEGRLYDIELLIKDGEKVLDRVATYTGFRKVELKDNRFYINGKPVFLRQVLDQGFYPDGVITAPKAEDLLKDINIGIKFGFNGARPHEKVFEERYLYYADKAGYLIWGEYPNWGSYMFGKGGKALKNFLSEWEEVVERDYNHPSIIGWCPLNETYGLFAYASAHASVAIYDKTKQLDSGRIVIGSSGGFHYKTDICDIHSYNHNPESIVPVALKRNNGTAFGILSKFVTIFNKRLLTPQQLKEYPLYLSEFGGLTYLAEGKTWGYHKAIKTEEEFLRIYEQMVNNIMECEEICGFCYTQLTDVEQEQNGLVKYNRADKFSKEAIEKIAAINKQKAKAEE
jgi:beta-galactosidase/beta-glucuronidase